MEKESNFIKDDDLRLKSVINSIPVPELQIGIDTQDTLIRDIASVRVSQIDSARIEAFTAISRKREQLYTLLDAMSEDSMVAAILEVFTEDATERNDHGNVVWAESSDENISKYINFLLDSLNVDKNIYKWTYSLCKYGDLYLKLFRESEVEDPIFKEAKQKKKLDEKLEEQLRVKAFSKNDKFVLYIEQVPNPAEIFELTKFGKTYGYIEAQISTQKQYNGSELSYYNSDYTMAYRFKKSDVTIYAATDYVHGCLEDDSDRQPEKVSIFLTDTDYDANSNAYTYSVKRGQSLLYPAFKIWRQLMLLENSILLNRLTKSSVVRLIGLEVKDMPKERVNQTLNQLKSMIEQKSAINESISMSEYTNPGAYENNIYLPTRDGQGNISVTTIGGDGDSSSGNLSDLDYFKNKFYGVFGIPKAYMGDTGDAAGFDGGKSLSILSSRYAKKIKRIQHTVLQTLTDAINIILIDKGMESYVNKFSLQIVPPTTQEELDRRDNMKEKIALAGDVVDLLSDVEDVSTKLRVLKSMLSGVVFNDEILEILQEEINKYEEKEKIEDNEEGEFSEPISMDNSSHEDGAIEMNFNDSEIPNEPGMEPKNQEPPTGGEEPTKLPSMEKIGLDFADSNNF